MPPDLRRQFVISSGSWETSIVGRNAMGRLLAGRLDGFFDEVDYVFFPAGVRGFHEPEPGFRVHEIPGRPDMDRAPGWGSRIRGFLEGWSEILTIARAHPPVLAHAVEPFLSGLLAREVSRSLGIPLVVTVVSNYRLSWEVGGLNPVPFLPAPWSFGLESRILSQAHRVHADCVHYAEYASERGAVEARIRHIPRYADPVFYEREPDPGIWRELEVPDPTPLVYVGRLSPEKYALDLAVAFLRVAREEPERHLVVVGGGGPDEKPFLNQILDEGAWERVHLCRGLAREQIVSAMGRAGVVLATHAGYTLLEGGLNGAPTVAYDYEWHPELIQDGVTGRLVPYRDPGAMAAAALELLRDRELAATLGAALREKTRGRYTREGHKAALRASYMDLLPPGAPAGRAS